MQDALREFQIRIDGAHHFLEMRGAREVTQERFRAALSSWPMERYNEIVNKVHDTIIEKVIVIAEEKLREKGYVRPSVRYAYMLFGSGGRSEQTLDSDQDSGLVYEAGEDCTEELVGEYFRKLAAEVVEGLQQIGYPPCDGGVVSNQPAWCLSVREWHQKLEEWFAEPNWENVRYLLIMADCRFIGGDMLPVVALKHKFELMVRQNPDILAHMLHNTLHHKPLIGPLRQLIRERYGEFAGGVDIKYGAYIPLVNAIRLLAVQAGIQETSTIGRIRRLEQAGVFSEEQSSVYRHALLLFLRMRYMAASRMKEGYYTSSGKLTSDMLTKEIVAELKTSMRMCRKLQRFVGKWIADNIDIVREGRLKGGGEPG